ncbi:MAG TPA: hypothetical protein DD490_02685 [Acidobacteria bacterium]|nr:hypothetical protein [Acidobacteriota bacterium]
MNGALLWGQVSRRMWRFKAKTLFMGLGITIGVLVAVLLQTVAGGVRATFAAFIERAYPADSVVLVAGSGVMGGGNGRNSLQLTDVEAVAGELGLAEWDPAVFIGARDVKNAGNNLRVNVAGCSEKAERVRRRSVEDGDFISADDVRTRAKVALLGSTTAAKLFPGASPIGEQVFIDNAPFEVKGILETVGVDPHGNDQDDVIQVPYTTLMDMSRITSISMATFVVGDRSRVEAVGKEITSVMRSQHQIGAGQEDDFSVLTSTQMQELLDRSFRTFNIFIPLIAGTAFLIAALVILSIMQINIKGRTPEIGLRKAVGARSRDLQAQIVLEVVLIAAVASVLGLLLAQVGVAAVAPILETKLGVKHLSTPPLVPLVSVAAALATGLLGGILPARRAAKLDPVKALK